MTNYRQELSQLRSKNGAKWHASEKICISSNNNYYRFKTGAENTEKNI